jgi:hypothetical protein
MTRKMQTIYLMTMIKIFQENEIPCINTNTSFN